jgi:predicted nucleotide-binding protein
MDNLSELIKEGNQLLKEMQGFERKSWQSDLMTRMRALHYKGRFLLKYIDKSIYNEYCNLFSNSFTKDYNTITYCIYLKNELEKCVGLFSAIDQLETLQVRDTSLKKVFISHGKFTTAFSKIESFLRSLGIIPIYDTNSPSEAKTINSHVESLISEADFYIILSTIETADKAGKKMPNHNVIIEYDRLIRMELKNIVILVEDGCTMPSMLQDIIYIPFSDQSMDNAFIKICSELRKSNIIN